MKNRAVSTLLALALCVTALCACGRPAAGSQSESQTPTWQEQYDLGVRYLSEGNYEEAILAFTAAIEIDPKQPSAYISLAELYITTGDFLAASDIVERGIQACGKLDEFISLENRIYRDSQESYQISLPIDYSVAYQEGDEIQIGSVFYSVIKENGKYKNSLTSNVDGSKRIIYGSLCIYEIFWSSGERESTVYPADSLQEEAILRAAPLDLRETYQFQREDPPLELEQFVEKYTYDGTMGESRKICGFGYSNGQYDYTLQEMLTTSNYLSFALYDKTGSRTGLLVLELLPSAEVLTMLEKHTVFEEINQP